MTKADRKIVDRYNFSDRYHLYLCYGSFSKRKADAWKSCKALCQEMGGKGLKVIGYNSNFFSAGFLFEEEGKEKLMYITHGGNRVIDL